MKVYILMYQDRHSEVIWGVYATVELREAEIQRIRAAHTQGARIHPNDLRREDEHEVEGA